MTMEGLVRQKSARERAVAEAALAALRAEEESEAALARELNETLFEIENLQGDDNVNSWSADIDGCMRHQNLVRRRDTTAGEEFIGVRISNTEALAQFQNGN